MRRLFFYKPTELLPYINWIYFFHAWGLPPRFNGIANVHNCKACRMSWVNSFSENERVQAREAEHLHSEAIGLLRTMNDCYEARALVELLPFCHYYASKVPSLFHNPTCVWQTSSVHIPQMNHLYGNGYTPELRMPM